MLTNPVTILKSDVFNRTETRYSSNNHLHFVACNTLYTCDCGNECKNENISLKNKI